MARKIFQAALFRPNGTGTWTNLEIPFSVLDEFGSKGQVKVKATINGVAYRGSLMPHGDGRHFLVVNKAVRDKAGVTAGDTVTVTVERDTAARRVTVPADFKRALVAAAKAQAAFKKLAYSHQKAYVDWIVEAKRPETRARRIESAVERVGRGEVLKK